MHSSNRANATYCTPTHHYMVCGVNVWVKERKDSSWVSCPLKLDELLMLPGIRPFKRIFKDDVSASRRKPVAISAWSDGRPRVLHSAPKYRGRSSGQTKKQTISHSESE